MPVVVVFDFPGEDTAKYHKVFELGGPAVNAQPSRLDHICYKTDNGLPSSTSGKTKPASLHSAPSSGPPSQEPA